MADSKILAKLKAIETILNGLVVNTSFKVEKSVGKKIYDLVKSSTLSNKVFLNLSSNQNFILIENNAAFRKFVFEVVITSKFAPVEMDNLPENMFAISEKIDNYFNWNENYVVNDFTLEYNSELIVYIINFKIECLYD